MGEKQGQWSVRETLNSRDVAFAIEEGRRPIADVYDSKCAGVPHTEVSRRARLIAAAPDLLEALIGFREAMSKDIPVGPGFEKWVSDGKRALEKVDFSIAKATGASDAQ